MAFNRNKQTGPKEEKETLQSWSRYSATSNPSKAGTHEVMKSYFYSSMSGVNTPNYHRRLKRGELLPLTPYYQVQAQGIKTTGERSICWKRSGGRIECYWTDGDFWPWDGWGVYPWQYSPTEIRNVCENKLTNEAVSWAAAKIYNSGFDGLTFAAELTKTVAMFKGVLRRWTKLAATGRFEKIWLEGRYGWRTLYYDMLEIQQLVNGINDGRKRFKQSAGFGESWEDLKIDSHSMSAGTSHWTSRTVFNISHRGTIVADIEPPKVIVNPALTAWELLTLSFVVDWFVQVGTWLEAMSFLTLTSKYHAAMGVRLTGTRNVYSTSFEPASSVSSATVTYSGASSFEAVRREPTSVPLSPTVNIRLDSFKVLDLVAIFLGKLRR